MLAMNHHERRNNPTIRETLTFKKEISIAWLVTILIGGIANFAAVVWIAATIVSEIGVHDKALAILEAKTASNTTMIAAQTVLIQAQQVMISETKESLHDLRERFNTHSDRTLR